MRKFEVQMPNDLWQSDCMHGPKVLHDDRLRKTYLFAIIDDHSRLITHGQFYLAENLDNYLDCLWTAMRKRGLPRKIYVDNGPSFKAHRLQLGCVSLEINLSFAKPYRPQGEGENRAVFPNCSISISSRVTSRADLAGTKPAIREIPGPLPYPQARDHRSGTYSAIPGKCRVPEVCPGEPAEVFPQKSCS